MWEPQCDKYKMGEFLNPFIKQQNEKKTENQHCNYQAVGKMRKDDLAVARVSEYKYRK